MHPRKRVLRGTQRKREAIVACAVQGRITPMPERATADEDFQPRARQLTPSALGRMPCLKKGSPRS